MLDLAFELARSPARISERNQAPCRTLVAADVVQDLTARRHCEAGVDVDGLGAAIVPQADDERENVAAGTDGMC